MENFDRDQSIEGQVAGQEDDPHAAAPELALDSILPPQCHLQALDQRLQLSLFGIETLPLGCWPPDVPGHPRSLVTPTVSIVHRIGCSRSQVRCILVAVGSPKSGRLVEPWLNPEWILGEPSRQEHPFPMSTVTRDRSVKMTIAAVVS